MLSTDIFTKVSTKKNCKQAKTSIKMGMGELVEIYLYDELLCNYWKWVRFGSVDIERLLTYIVKLKESSEKHVLI